MARIRAGVLAFVALSASAAVGEVTSTDLQVAARALSFMEEPLSGSVRVGIVYSRSSARSESEAEAIRQRLGAGLRVGNLELRPVMVPLEQAGRANVDLFLLTEHVPAGAEGLAHAAQAKRIPCVTTDVEQARSGACAMAVRSRPKVEIIVNRDAASQSGMRFATAFRVMVTEI